MSLGLILTGFVGPLNKIHANTGSINPNTFDDSSYTEDELKQIEDIEKDLKFYLEEAGQLTENGYEITDYEAIQERIDNGDKEAQRVLELSEQQDDVVNNQNVSPQSANDFATCVVNKFVSSYGNIARAWMTGAIYTYIKNKQYDLAARLMFNTLVKAGRTANVASLAVEAGIYGYQCRGQW